MRGGKGGERNGAASRKDGVAGCGDRDEGPGVEPAEDDLRRLVRLRL